MKTTTQELKQYITRLFQLSNSETWECEALEKQKIFYQNVLLIILHLRILHLKLIPTIMMSYMS